MSLDEGCAFARHGSDAGCEPGCEPGCEAERAAECEAGRDAGPEAGCAAEFEAGVEAFDACILDIRLDHHEPVRAKLFPFRCRQSAASP